MHQPLENLRYLRQLCDRPSIGGLKHHHRLGERLDDYIFSAVGESSSNYGGVEKRLVMSGREWGRVSFSMGMERPSWPAAFDDDF